MNAPSARSRSPRRAVTGRALVLGAVVVALLVLLASPLSHYLGSRSDLSSAAVQLHRDQTRLHALKAQKARWSDPGYVQQQARERLQFAMPGDTVYEVTGEHSTNGIDRTVGPGPAAKRAGSWNTRLWGSVERADAAS